MFLGRHTELIIERVVPDLFHIIPISHNSVFHWVSGNKGAIIINYQGAGSLKSGWWFATHTDTELVIERVMPDLFHVVPICYNSVLHWVSRDHNMEVQIYDSRLNCYSLDYFKNIHEYYNGLAIVLTTLLPHTTSWNQIQSGTNVKICK